MNKLRVRKISFIKKRTHYEWRRRKLWMKAEIYEWTRKQFWFFFRCEAIYYKMCITINDHYIKLHIKDEEIINFERVSRNDYKLLSTDDICVNIYSNIHLFINLIDTEKHAFLSFSFTYFYIFPWRNAQKKIYVYKKNLSENKERVISKNSLGCGCCGKNPFK